LKPSSEFESEADALWHLLMRLSGFLADRGLLRQNLDTKQLISDLTFRQHQVIREVYLLTQKQPEGVQLKQLAERLGLSPGTASEAVETLVRKKALVRETCATDRRSVRIRVSPQGQNMIRIGIDQYLQDSALLLSALSPEEAVQLIAALKRLVEKIPDPDGDTISGMTENAKEFLK